MRSETELLREALIGSVSHELRTPLASILGAATILSNAPALADDARLHALTLLVRDEAERLNNNIQNLLDATTISSHRVRPKLQWIEPVDIFNAALEHRSRRLAGHPVTLDLDSNLPIVRADPMQVEQTLMQILDNAAKYSADGAPIRVAARPNGQSVVLSVHDCGAGLTEEEKRRSAAASSAARGLPPARRDRASACGSPTLSSPRMVARSMSRATAPTGAPLSIHLPLPGEATPSQISIDE